MYTTLKQTVATEQSRHYGILLMKMFYNGVNSLICCAKKARSSIVLNTECVKFVLQNCEELHSVRGLYDKKQRLIVLFTSDVMYN